MANLNIAIKIAAQDQASGPIGKITNAIGGLGSTARAGFGGLQSVVGGALIATTAAAAAGVVALGGALAFSIGEAAEAEKVQAQLNAVLESTGGAAGLTADEVNAMASELQKVTTYGDDAIISGQNLLLTFTNIGEDVFPQATETMLDMATALGTDASGSAIQLGKALNDPVAGISALSRVGVTFTDQQKEMIATMVEAGDVTGAQQVILDELAKEFGGSARAAAETFTGRMDQLKNQVGEVGETIGGALLPFLTSLAERVLPIVVSGIEAMQTPLQYVSQALLALTQGDTAGFWENMRVAVFGFGLALGVPIENIRLFVERVETGWAIVQGFITQLQELGARFVEFVTPLVTAVTQFVGWQDVLAAVGVVIASIVIPALFSIVSAVAPVIAVGVLLIGAIALLRNAWENDWGGIQEKTFAVIEFIRNLITTVLTGIQEFWATHGEFIMAVVAGMWENLKLTVSTAIAIVQTVVSTVLAAIQEF
ncbi:MAG: hypothetical protein HC804_00100, partial [Anaerolineae bacterium]|nr:hypothetical protein [Anaerolineae bacterium]